MTVYEWEWEIIWIVFIVWYLMNYWSPFCAGFLAVGGATGAARDFVN